jgi:glycosyltransferase involved in cell wall biosynthesis
LLLLIFARYSSSQASTRVRFTQYIPALTLAGFDVEVFPILDDDAISGRSGVLSSAWSRLKSFGRVAKRLLQERNRDSHIHIYIEMFPWLPFFVERMFLLMAGKREYSVELDDAWFHKYDTHQSALVRAVLATKIDRMMQRSTLVIAGNDYIAQRARAAKARWVETIPTVVDVDRYRCHGGSPGCNAEPASAPANPQSQGANDELPVIGWIGSPATTPLLLHIKDVIERMHHAGLARFVAIGAGASELARLPIRCIPWSEAAEVGALHQLDIGIMPLTDTLFERGKSGYKIVQYMACGLPSVASPVGANRSIVVHGQTGFLASTDDEWFEYLSKLCGSKSLRSRLGKSGLARAEEHYSLRVTAPKMVSIFKRLLSPADARSRAAMP